MPDLWLGKEWPRDRVVEFLNRLIDLGVAGFRIDAAKHMWPGDLDQVIKRLNNVRSE
jgi:alpha-amylase